MTAVKDLVSGRRPEEIPDEILEANEAEDAAKAMLREEAACRKKARAEEAARQAEERAAKEREAEVKRLTREKKEAEDAFADLEERVLDGLADVAHLVEKGRHAIGRRNDAGARLAELGGRAFSQPDRMALPELLDARDPLGHRLAAKFLSRVGAPSPGRTLDARLCALPVIRGQGAPDVTRDGGSLPEGVEGPVRRFPRGLGR